MAYPNNQPPMRFAPPDTNPESHAPYTPDNSQPSLPSPQYPPAKSQNPHGSSPYQAANSPYPSAPAQYPPANSQYPPANSQYPPANSQYPPANSQYPSANSQYPPANSQYPPAAAQYPPANSKYPPTPAQDSPENSKYPSAPAQDPPANSQYPSAPAQYPPANSKYPSAPAQDPPANSQYPPANSKYPPANSPYPSAPSQDPPANSPYPSAPSQDPPANSQYPPANSKYPSAPAQYPPTNSKYPSAPAQDPSANSKYPPANSQYPPANSKYPPANSQYPPANSKYPAAPAQDPPANSQYPPANSPYPSAPSQDPPANSQYPPANSHYPPANSQAPLGSPQYHAANSRYPPAHAQYPPANSQYPPGNAQQPPSATTYGTSPSATQQASSTIYSTSNANSQFGGTPQPANYRPSTQQYENRAQESTKGSRSGLTSMAWKMASSKIKPLGIATQFIKPILAGSTSSSQAHQNSFPTPVPRQTTPFVPSGRRKAVLVGVNYLKDRKSKLSGCINDANCMRYLLLSKFDFNAQNIVMMTDDSSDANYQPTRQNILNALGWLVNGAQQGDTLFFHFSGHGSQTPDRNGDEVDGMDETICPVDFKQRGMIVDDELHARLCACLPYGCRLIAVMDCCHSGTGLDLPYTYYRNSRGTIQPEVDQPSIRKGNETMAQVVLFSSCKDSQTAADTKALAGGTYTGAATYSFIQAVEQQYPNLTFESLLDSMSRALKRKGYRQTAQLSAGHAMDLRIPFQM